MGGEIVAINFFSLGFIAVATPGTRVRPFTFPLICQLARLQPRRSASVLNVGNVYIYGQQTGGQPYAILAPEQVQGIPIPYNNFDLSNIWIDADNANDAVLVGYNQ